MALNPLWEEIFSSREWGKYPSEDLIRFIARNFYKVKERNKIKILEVGAGTGSNVWYLLNEGFSVYAVEGSKSGVNIIKSRIEKDLNINSKMLNVLEGNINTLPFEDAFFDAVIDIEAIYNNSWEESKKIVNEIHRVLKPEGKFYSRHFAENSSGDKTGEFIEKNTYIPSEGVLKGIGQARFASEEDIRVLFGEKFQIYSLEHGIRTLNNRKDRVIEWQISMIKKG